MLISHIALVGCIVFNAFTSPSLTHAKPIPSGGQSNALSTLNTSPINGIPHQTMFMSFVSLTIDSAQVNTESSIPGELKSRSPQQLWPHNEVDVPELQDLLKRANRLLPNQQEQFFRSDMESQWNISKGDLDNPHANFQKSIQRAADLFDCLRGLRVLLDKGNQDLPPNDAASIKQMAEKYIDEYAILIVQQPFFPKECMSLLTAHAILDHIKRNKLQVSVIGFETFVERLEKPRAST
ncbi:hypothetical protein H0H93_016320 [Arthromyces matolae]|nr:hypothetical protein H0H93_016320 [Arthromyces matolae]